MSNSANARSPRQLSPSSGDYENRTARMGYLSQDMRDRKIPSSIARSPSETELPGATRTLDTNLRIMLMVQDDLRRYSIEGMLRSLDMKLPAQFGRNVDDLSLICDGQLIISSIHTLNPLPGDIAARLRHHKIPVLILVDPADVVEQSWADHASGFLDWVDLRPETLREAIVDVGAGRFHVSATLVRRSVTTPDRAGDETTSGRRSTISLTPREHQILRLIAEGLSNRQTARSLGVSEHGVKRTVGIILAKLNCPNRTLAVVRAIECGLLVM